MNITGFPSHSLALRMLSRRVAGFLCLCLVSLLVLAENVFAAPTPTAVTQVNGVLKVAAPAMESSEIQLTADDNARTFTITSLDATKTTLAYIPGQGCSKPDVKNEEVVCVLERNAPLVNEIQVITGNQADNVKMNFPRDSYGSETFPEYVAGKVPLTVNTGDGQDQINLQVEKQTDHNHEISGAEAEANSTLTAGSGNDTVTVAVASTYRGTVTYSDPQRMAIYLGSGEDTLNASKTNILPLLVIPGPGLDRDDITGSSSRYYNKNDGYLDPPSGDKFLADAAVDGNDIFYSPSGEAEVSYEKRTAGVKVSLDGVNNDGDIATGETDNVKPSIQSVVGSSADDVLDVTVTGMLAESIGSRRAYGKGGGDTITAGNLPSGNSPSLNILDGGSGGDNIIGSPSMRTNPWSVEWLVGGPDNDTLEGGGAAEYRYSYDVFVPGDGNDTMKGGSGGQAFFLSGTTGKAEGTDVIDNTGLDPSQSSVYVSYSNGLLGDGFPDQERFPVSVATTESSRGAHVSVTRDGVANDGEPAEGDSIPANINGVIGGNGNDTLGSATEVFDYISGEGGNDTLSYGKEMEGRHGDDTITANPTGSTIDGGDNKDTLTGGPNRDVINGGDGEDLINGGGGDDRLTDFADSNSSNNTIFGGEGHDDVIANSDGNTTVYGNNGNDTISVYLGSAKLYGGDGNDTLTSDGRDDILDGGVGNNILKAGDGRNTITAGGGNDTITSGTGDDDVNAGGGDDIINPGLGDDTVDAGDGNNQLFDTGGSDRLVSGGGNDTMKLTGSTTTDRDVYQTGSGPDSVESSDVASSILGKIDIDSGGQGDSVVLTAPSLDSNVYAGGGNDTVKAHNASGGDGDDVLVQTKENDDGGSGSLAGDAGNDQLLSSDFFTCYRTDAENTYISDSLNGGSGNDRLVGGGGSDTLVGGSGDDQLIGGYLISCKGDPLAATAAQFDDSAGYVDTLSGEDGNDSLNGSTDDQMQGGDDSDQIVLDAAYVYSDRGAHSGASGPSLNAQGDIYGGNGLDSIDYSISKNSSYGGVQVSLDDLANDGAKMSGSNKDGFETPSASKYPHNVHSDIENIVGTSLGDLLVGSAAANNINGGGGTNVIVGGTGSDVLSGGRGYGAGYIYARDGERDEVQCAEYGKDGEAEVDSLDVVSNCDTTRVGSNEKKENTPCKVTNLVGTEKRQAMKTLGDNNCRSVISAWWWVSTAKAAGEVFKQSARPGQYESQVLVSLTVTKKTTKKWCSVPSLLGKKTRASQRALQQLQCNVIYRYKRVKSKRKWERVVSQSVKGKIRSAKTITVTIGTKR